MSIRGIQVVFLPAQFPPQINMRSTHFTVFLYLLILTGPSPSFSEPTLTDSAHWQLERLRLNLKGYRCEGTVPFSYDMVNKLDENVDNLIGWSNKEMKTTFDIVLKDGSHCMGKVPAQCDGPDCNYPSESHSDGYNPSRGAAQAQSRTMVVKRNPVRQGSQVAQQSSSLVPFESSAQPGRPGKVQLHQSLFPTSTGFPGFTPQPRPFLSIPGTPLLQPQQPTSSTPFGNPEADLTGRPRVQVGSSVRMDYPFTTVGFLENGCSGALVGPCHVLTAGHCVYSHEKGEFSGRLGFTPGKNGQQQTGQIPWKEFRVSQGWRLGRDYAADYALVVLQRPVGSQIGWLGFGYNLNNKLASLNIAGYPTDRPFGTMWFDYCEKVQLDYSNGRVASHGCQVVEGNSGSPMWVFSPKSGFREIRAVHNGARITRGGAIPYATVITPEISRDLKQWIGETRC